MRTRWRATLGMWAGGWALGERLYLELGADLGAAGQAARPAACQLQMPAPDMLQDCYHCPIATFQPPLPQDQAQHLLASLSLLLFI